MGKLSRSGHVCLLPNTFIHKLSCHTHSVVKQYTVFIEYAGCQYDRTNGRVLFPSPNIHSPESSGGITGSLDWIRVRNQGHFHFKPDTFNVELTFSGSSRHIIWISLHIYRRSQWPRIARHEMPSLARTLGSWVRIPLKAWMSVCVYSLCR
jgi:hypothetical protein